MGRQKLMPKQAAAVKWRMEVGEKIAREYPQVAENFRSGWYQNDIAKEYGFMEKYMLNSEKMAEDAVGYALKLLMPPGELRRISTEHQRAAQKESGLQAKEHGTGVHSLSKKENSKYAKEGAEKIMREKLGIFKPGYKRGASENQIRSRGLIPWTDEQRQYFAELCSNPEYRKHDFKNQYTKSGTGAPDYQKIAKEIERKFGVRRNPRYLPPYFYRMKKKSETKAS